MQHRLGGNNMPTAASSSSSIPINPPPPPHQHQKHHQQQVANNQNNNSNNFNNEFIQRQIVNEIQRFESVHPCIYRIYDLIEKIDNEQVANLIRQQVISIEDAFVNSQEWTMSRMINEIRLGVVGSEDSCKNSLIHYFLTRNWNWEDAPEGGRFKKEVVVDGRSFLLLIRDEGSREPNLQFSQWLDALLLVFTLDSRDSFQYALELQQFVNNFRSMEAGDVPIYLIGMKNMTNLGMQRMVSEEEAHKMAKARKLCQYFECLDGSSVQRMFSHVCQRVVQQRNSSSNGGGGTRTASCSSANSVSSYIGSGGFGRQTSCISIDPGGDHPMLNSMLGSATGTPSASSNYAVAASGHSAGRPSSYHHQRSISVLPINSGVDLLSSSPSPAHHLHQSSAAGIRGAGRTPRFDGEFPQPQFQPQNAGSNFRGASSFGPNYSTATTSAFYQQMGGGGEERRRDSLIVDWQRRPIVGSSPSPASFAIPSTPSCSALLLGGGPNNRNGGGNAQHHIGGGGGEQLAGLSPAYSHSSLSSSHYQLSSGPTAMAAAPSPYSRSTSNMLHHHAHAPGGHHQFGGGRPCSDPMSQSPGAGLFHHHPQQNDIFFDGQLSAGGLHPLSTATSSSTLVVNNGNGGSQANMLPTPGNTPKTERKGKRISNIFRKDPTSTPDERLTKQSVEVNMGIGRAIPVKQGQLYKRSKNGLNKEWKKKFVCLYPDGRICYHQNLKDYMDKDSRGKEIYLGLATVRTSDRHKQKGGNRLSLLPSSGGAKGEKQQQNYNNEPFNDPEDYLKSPTGGGGELSEGISDSCGGETTGNGGGSGGNANGLVNSTSSSVLLPGEKEKMVATSTSGGKKEKHKEKKKRAKRVGSGAGKHDEDEESCEFEIITCDQKRWEFSAPSAEERDGWVASIEREIEKCLQQQLSLKDQQQLGSNGNRNGQMGLAGSSALSSSSAAYRGTAGISLDSAAEKRRANIQQIRQLEGNDRCADCGAPHPQWASINLGTLICIECSGIHRKLGSHISKVRSLELDDWPNEHLVVMQAIGNGMANQIWEHNASARDRPTPEAGHAQKEQWIRRKYEDKLFLPPIPVDRTLAQQLVDAVLGRNVKQLLMVLPRCTKADVNTTIGGQSDRRTAVHLACGIGAPEILQLLIWYNADIRALDEQGRSALWHAQVNGSQECAAILMQAGLRTSNPPLDAAADHHLEANNRTSFANLNLASPDHQQHQRL